ncbi:MAG TPA: SGNH/GDSL hydrolase family protein [Chthonomonadales bacterium]|nr:SGNH/GDSL hydrolase family protein [Chthonomonadales bacterium]
MGIGLSGGGIRRIEDISGLRQAIGGSQVGTRCFYRGARGTADHEINGAMRHFVREACCNLRLVYANFYASATKEDPNTSAIPFKASIEDSSGGIWPVFFHGVRTFTVPAGAIVVSDPVSIDVAAGDWVRSRTYCTAGAGEQAPVTANSIAAMGDGIRSGAGQADLTDTAYASWSATNGNGPGPQALLGETRAGNPVSLAFVGDSMAGGTQDWEDSTGAAAGQMGWPRRLVQSLVPWIGISSSGDRLEWLIATRRLRLQLAGYCSHCLVQLGANDVASGATFAQVTARYEAVIAMLLRRGVRPILATIVPKATSTDGFRTVTNQTPAATEAARIQVNEWMRARPAGVWDVWDAADACESARNSGRWHVGSVDIADAAATGGSTTTVVRTGSGWGANQFIGKAVVMKTGANANTCRLITSNTADTLTTVAFASAVAAGDAFTVGEYPTEDGTHPVRWVHIRIASELASSGALSRLVVP